MAWLRARGRAILADEPGLGKSAQALYAARGRTLVIAPAMMYEAGDWLAETALWPDLPTQDLTFTTYGLVPRRKANSKGELRLLEPFPKAELRGPWDTLIIDEAHYLRTRDAKWTEAIQRIKAKQVFLLTGTPLPNWSHEIFSLLRTIFPDDPRFSNYRRWVETWFDTRPAQFGGPYSIEIVRLLPGLSSGCRCASSWDVVTQKWSFFTCESCWAAFRKGNDIESHLLRRTWPEVGIELPPKQEQTIHVPLTPAQAKLYRELKANYVAWVEGSGQEVSAWSAGGLHTKLAQIASSVNLVDSTFSGRGSSKLERLEEILADRVDSAVIIGTQFRRSAEMVIETATRLGRRPGLIMGGMTNRGETKRAFQSGDIDTLVGTLDSISESIQLQRANTVIFFEHSWRPDRNEQFIKRAWRMGQTRNVLVIHLIARGTIDDSMQDVLAAKTHDQIQMLTAREFAALL